MRADTLTFPCPTSVPFLFLSLVFYPSSPTFHPLRLRSNKVALLVFIQCRLWPTMYRMPVMSWSAGAAEHENSDNTHPGLDSAEGLLYWHQRPLQHRGKRALKFRQKVFLLSTVRRRECREHSLSKQSCAIALVYSASHTTSNGLIACFRERARSRQYRCRCGDRGRDGPHVARSRAFRFRQEIPRSFHIPRSFLLSGPLFLEAGGQSFRRIDGPLLADPDTSATDRTVEIVDDLGVGTTRSGPLSGRRLSALLSASCCPPKAAAPRQTPRKLACAPKAYACADAWGRCDCLHVCVLGARGRGVFDCGVVAQSEHKGAFRGEGMRQIIYPSCPFEVHTLKPSRTRAELRCTPTALRADSARTGIYPAIFHERGW